MVAGKDAHTTGMAAGRDARTTGMAAGKDARTTGMVTGKGARVTTERFNFFGEVELLNRQYIISNKPMQTVSDPISNARQRAAEALKKLPWLTEAQAALGWGIILILIALLGAIYLSQTSRIAIVGRLVQV